MYDANTGNLILQIANAILGGTTVEGPNGELLVYVLGNNWLAMWNSSLCIQNSAPTYPVPFNSFNNEWTWRPGQNFTLDWSTGVQWNATVQTYPMEAIAGINSGVILGATNTGLGGILGAPQSYDMEVGYSSTTGQQLWVQNVTLPSGPATGFTYVVGPMADGIFTAYDALAEQWYGFNANTGEKVWGPTVADTDPWGSEAGFSSLTANGILYGLAADGVSAFNLTNGQLLWRFHGIDSGTDFPGFTYYPFVTSGMTIADGKVYVNTGDTHGDAMLRGAQLYCVNATTGALIWNINNFADGNPMPISDGVLLTDNMYDNQIYAWGMGPTKTTVNAPDVGVTTSTPITITGTVTDISAGASQQAVAANFPNGLPCISDASMTQWMEYVYMQQPKPTNATGVTVALTTLDSNGNTYSIGNVTTDDSGNYGLMWTPPVPGLYKVMAAFCGSNSYYMSSAVTYMSAGEAPSPAVIGTPAPTPVSSPATLTATPSPVVTVTPVPPPSSAGVPTTYIVIAAVAIIVVVAAAALALRRKK